MPFLREKGGEVGWDTERGEGEGRDLVRIRVRRARTSTGPRVQPRSGLYQPDGYGFVEATVVLLLRGLAATGSLAAGVCAVQPSDSEAVPVARRVTLANF